jgi:hypothetical protein
MVSALIGEANPLAEKVINAGNANALVHQYRDDADTTDEKVLAYREAMNQVNLRILDWQSEIEKYIVAAGYVSTEPVDVEAVSAEYTAFKTQIKAATSMLKNLPGGEAVIAELPELKNLPGTRQASGGSTGTARPRVSEVAVKAAGEDWYTALSGKGPKDKEGNETHVSNFSTLARYFSKSETPLDVPALHAAAFAAAGTEDLSSLHGVPIEFAVGTTMVRVTPTVKR